MQMDRLVEYDKNKKCEKECDTSDDRRGSCGSEVHRPSPRLKLLAVIGKDTTDGFDGWLDHDFRFRF